MVTQITEITLHTPDGEVQLGVNAPCKVRDIPDLKFKAEEDSKIPYKVFGKPGNWELLVAKPNQDFEVKEEGLDYVCEDDDIIKWNSYRED